MSQRNKWIVGLSTAAVAVVALMLAACGTIFNTAETPQQRAYALLGTFAAIEETALELVTNPATPDAAVEAIAQADAAAKPLADALLAAAEAYLVAPDASTEVRLIAAYRAALPLVEALITLVQGVTARG